MFNELNLITNNCFESFPGSSHPINRRMQPIVDSIVGMGTENISFMINELVRCFAVKGSYVEVGCLRGRSLISAAFQNDSTKCIGIDNFSEYDHNNENETALLQNIKNSGQKNIKFFNGDYREILSEILDFKSVDVYFYDGPHRYQDQLDGLEIMLPYFKDKCVIIVDDVCWSNVARANDDFCLKHADFKQFVRVAPHDGTFPHGQCPWWNGFEIIYRDV